MRAGDSTREGPPVGTQVFVESTCTTSHRHRPGTSGPHHPQGWHPDGHRRRFAWSPSHRHTQQLLGISREVLVLGRVPGGRTASTRVGNGRRGQVLGAQGSEADPEVAHRGGSI